jgi:hypothetical protein
MSISTHALNGQIRANRESPSCTFNGEPAIPQVHYYHNDIAVAARFSYSLGGIRGVVNTGATGGALTAPQDVRI